MHCLFLRADEQDVDHVSRFALRIGNSSRNFPQKRGSNGWNGRFRWPANSHRCNGAQARIEHFDFHLEISLGAFCVAQALVNSQKQPTRYWRFVIRARADCEWLRDIVVAQTPDQRAVTRIAHCVLVN